MRVSHQVIADKLLEEGFLLTALEFHTELLESGQELKSLKDFFSNSQNFSNSSESPGRGTADIRRSESQVTLDSIDRLTRYSEDTDRREEDRVAILEYELRTNRETIAQLRAELQELTVNQQRKATPGTSGEEDKDEEEEEEIQIKPHEKKLLNYLVNDYLMRNGYKFTAVTFSDEANEQNLDDWDEVSSYSLGTPTILSLYRNSGLKQLNERSDSVEGEVQTTEVKVLEETEWRLLNNDMQRINAEKEELVLQVESILRTNSELEEALQTNIVESEESIGGMRSKIIELETEKQALAEKVRDLTKISSQNNIRPPAEHDLAPRPQHEREDGDGASIIDEPLVSPSVSGDLGSEQQVCLPKSLDQFIFLSASEIPRPVSESFQKTFLEKVFPISIDENLVEHIDIGDVLATSLPKLISNLVLSSRIDVVPLLVYAISCQKDARSRESLIGVLFNLMKRPDPPTRRTVLSGLLWLLHQPGWDSKRIEEELLPHCLDQMNQKYLEKKILVGQTLTVLASYIERTIRSSLLISMVLQLLNDKEPEVIVTALRSLAILINLLEDGDKMEQVYNVIVSLLTSPDTSQEIFHEVQNSVMPVINVWLMKAGKSFRLVDGLLKDVEVSPVLERTTSLDDTAAVDEAIESKESLVRNLNLIESQMSSVVFSVINTFPSHSRKDKSSEDNLSFVTTLETTQTWPQYEQFMEYMSRLATFFKKVPTQDATIIDCCSKLLSLIFELTGSQFSEEKLFPLMESSLEPCAVLSIFSISLTRDNSSFPRRAISLVRTWTVTLAGLGLQSSGLLAPLISFLTKERKQWVVIESLRELVADPSPLVRCEVGDLLSLLVTPGTDLSSPDTASVVSRMLVPALVSLTSDPDLPVKKTAAPALVSLLAIACLDWEVSSTDPHHISSGLSLAEGESDSAGEDPAGGRGGGGRGDGPAVGGGAALV